MHAVRSCARAVIELDVINGDPNLPDLEGRSLNHMGPWGLEHARISGSKGVPTLTEAGVHGLGGAFINRPI